ncbi:MAG: histidine phosphatase family protein [Rhodospirillaceae bacterium]|nr:histidine phosphatase family protein [Rhodospirillaceae bacterium]
MTTVTRWWWIRHAPVINPGGRIYGQSDVAADLSDSARFEALGLVLPGSAVWVTSQLSRCRDTAAAIRGAGSAPPPIVDPALAEQNFGEWQGKSHAEIGFHDDHKLWLASAEFVPPGGESFAQMMIRVAEAVDRLTLAHPGRDIVAVAHGGTIRAALGHALALGPERALAFSVDTLSLTRLDHIARKDGGRDWRIAAINVPPPASA